MIDWSAGSYEQTAGELEPASEAVVARAALRPGELVVDLACGTGNATLLAAAADAQVTGVDSAVRLLELARERARAAELDIEFRPGELSELPVPDHAADVVLSVFGLVFAPDPARALREVARILRPGGRVLISAWVPAGPIQAMLSAVGSIIARITQSTPPSAFDWSDPVALGALAAQADLALVSTVRLELPIRDASPESYVLAQEAHPMALAIQPVLDRAGAREEAYAAMGAALREANEDPSGFLVHSPYVVHELRAG